MSIEAVTQEFRSGSCRTEFGSRPDGTIASDVLTPLMFETKAARPGDRFQARSCDGWTISCPTRRTLHLAALADELDDDHRQGGMCDRIIGKAAFDDFRIEDHGGEPIHAINNEWLSPTRCSLSRRDC